MIPILLMRSRRPREGVTGPQSHTSKWWSQGLTWDLTPESQALEDLPEHSSPPQTLNGDAGCGVLPMRPGGAVGDSAGVWGPVWVGVKIHCLISVSSSSFLKNG